MTKETDTQRTPENGDICERFYVSTLHGKPRLYRQWKDENGRLKNQVLPITDDDLKTVEGVRHAKARWRQELIQYPCHWCGKPMEMTLSELRFLSIHMLNRYEIGALPVCSKECAERLKEAYDNGNYVIQENTIQKQRV